MRALRQNYVDWWDRCSTHVRQALEALDHAAAEQLIELGTRAVDELAALEVDASE
jgi:hypothetical protein